MESIVEYSNHNVSSTIDNALVKLAFVYNQYIIDLIMDIKSINASKSRQILKQSSHKTIDPKSTSYIEHGAAMVLKYKQAIICAYSEIEDERKDPFPSKSQVIRDLEFIPRVNFGSLLDILDESATDTDKNLVYMYIHVLITLSMTLLSSNDVGTDITLVDTVLSRISLAQNNCDGSQGGIVDDQQDQSLCVIVIDSDIEILLKRLSDMVVMTAMTHDDDKIVNDDDANNLICNSKIANLAKEVASSIDLSNLTNFIDCDNSTNQSPDISKLTQNSSLIGEIVSSVGSKIQTKIESGELNQQELIKEAFSLMTSLNGSGAGGKGLGGLGSLLNGLTGAGNRNHKRNNSHRKKGDKSELDMNRMMSDILKNMSGL